jgi:hypothetical protein
MGTKIVLFWRNVILSETKMAIMAIVMFGGKRGGLQVEEHHTNSEAAGVAASCCGGALLQEGLVHFTK